jgi:hypothetical protein
VEPIIGKAVDKPAPLADALARPRHIIRIDATLEAVRARSVAENGPFHYRPEVLEQLLRHGVRPTDMTRPELVHEFVSDLYRHELRALRDRLVAKEFPSASTSAASSTSATATV